MALEKEQEITNRRNVPRFFVERLHICGLAAKLLWLKRSRHCEAVCPL